MMSGTLRQIETIPIGYEWSRLIEQAYFMYNAKLKVSRYLMTDALVDKQLLHEYLSETENSWVELQLYMDEVSQLYPSQFGYAHYRFDFENAAIEYSNESWDFND